VKTAIWIDDNRKQLILTPETEIDKEVLRGVERVLDGRCFRAHFRYDGAESMASEYSWAKQDLIIVDAK